MLNISFYLFLSLNFYFLPFCLISKLLFSTVVVVLRLKYFSQAMLAYFTVQSCNRGSKATKPEANWRQKTERGVESRQRENENVVISFSVFPLFHFPLSLSLSLSNAVFHSRGITTTASTRCWCFCLLRGLFERIG